MEKRLIGYGVEAINQLYDKSVKENIIQVQTTRKEFEGEYTLVVFPLLRFSGKSPEITASETLADCSYQRMVARSGPRIIIL